MLLEELSTPLTDPVELVRQVVLPEIFWQEHFLDDTSVVLRRRQTKTK